MPSSYDDGRNDEWRGKTDRDRYSRDRQYRYGVLDEFKEAREKKEAEADEAFRASLDNLRDSSDSGSSSQSTPGSGSAEGCIIPYTLLLIVVAAYFLSDTANMWINRALAWLNELLQHLR